MPLFSCEHWDWADRTALPEMTHGFVSFEPLFVYDIHNGVSVYYDDDAVQIGDTSLLSFLSVHPEHFCDITRDYRRLCDRLRHACNDMSLGVGSLRRWLLTLLPFSRLIDVVATSSQLEDGSPLKKRAQRAQRYDDTVLFVAESTLWALLNAGLGDGEREVLDFLTYHEARMRVFDQTDAENRSRGFVYFRGDLYTGIPLSSFCAAQRIALDTPSVETSDSLHGTVACSGRVRGIARIVNDHSEGERVSEGDILVATRTYPSFLPALERAAAFVTDQSGADSHTASAAREMEKPCVIGVPDASRTLRDGEFVEVDGEQGVIHRLG